MKSSIYINRPLLNASQLTAYAEAVGLRYPLLAVEMHTTLAYSRDPVDWTHGAFIPDPTTILVEGGKRSIQRFNDGAVVLEFESRLLTQRWSQFIMAGASWDFPDFRAHVTLAYDTETDVAGLVPPSLTLKFGPERREPLDPNWDEDKMKGRAA
jgi:hypothetical protein